MAWIRTIPEESAEGELEALYAQARDPSTGRVDNVVLVHGLHPAGLAAHWQLYRACMRPTPGLRKLEREMIAYAVSDLNGCHYRRTHHRRGLLRLAKDPAWVDAVVERPDSDLLSERQRAMLGFVRKLTETPADMRRDDVEALRRVGFEDRDVLEIVETTAYYAYANRIADGLGVELEPPAPGAPQTPR